MDKEDRTERKVILTGGFVTGTEPSTLLEGGRTLAVHHDADLMDVVRDLIDVPGPDEHDPLTREDRMLVWDYFYENMSYRDMAHRYKWGSHETARRKVQTVLTKIRSLLEEAGVTDETFD